MTQPKRSEEEVKHAWARVEQLARELPCLAGAPGVSPLDPFALDEWTASEERTPLERHAGRLVLAAFHPLHNWDSGEFDLDDACWVWDQAHRDAFTRWAREAVFVFDWMVDRSFIQNHAGYPQTAEAFGKPVDETQQVMGGIMEKLGARDLRELACILTVARMLSHGGREGAEAELGPSFDQTPDE